MQIHRHDKGDVTVIAFDGRLDSNTAPGVQQELERQVPDHGLVLLDLSAMSYMSSAGLRILLLMYRQAQRTGVKLALVGVPEDIHAIMSATGFLDFFAVAETVERGMEALTA